jgi:histone-lysine N-methyltransferase SETMAR
MLLTCVISLLFLLKFSSSIDNLPANHIRHIIYHEYSRGTTAAQAARNINAVYGEGSITEQTCRTWYNRFRSGDITLGDQPRPGRPSELDNQALIALVKENNRQTTRDLAEQLGVSHSTVADHLRDLGYRSKFGAWVPHELTEANKWQRLSIASSLLSRYNRKSFLPRLITGDEKWVFHINFRRKRQWVGPAETPSPDPKLDPHRKKLMLCVLWDLEGVIYWELLDSKTTLTAAVYSQQLDRLAEAVRTKRPSKTKVIIQHDNARPHVAKLTKAKIQELGWEVLPHPAYSPDLAPSDYHLFRDLQSNLDELHFENDEEAKKWLRTYFDQKPRIFFDRGIRSLPAKWAQVILNNGEYLT